MSYMDPYRPRGRPSDRGRLAGDGHGGSGPPKIALHASQADDNKLRWVAVMGTRLLYSRHAVAPHPWQRALLPAILLLLTMLASSDGCRVDQCWNRYNNMIESGHIERGANVAFCKALRDHSDCIRDTARSCRGDLKYHSTNSLLATWNQDYNCSFIIMTGNTPPPSTRPPKIAKTPKPTGGHACYYHGKHDFQHCALFGDPHLRTFSSEFQTCKVLGAWPLIDNAYLAVQVTNDAVGPANSNATAPTKVTVLIKGGNGPCAHHKTYEAQVGNLPSAFVDGTMNSGSDKTVRIKAKEAGQHVEIVIRYIATTIVIRQVGDFLNVAMRVPREVIGQGVTGDGLQLCTQGCPPNERINATERLSRQRPGPELSLALLKCRECGLSDAYLDACVFDLLTTGDVNFCHAANKAMHDLRNLNPALYAQLHNRTELLVPTVVLTPEQQPSTGGGATSAGARAALLLLALGLAAVLAS